MKMYLIRWNVFQFVLVFHFISNGCFSLNPEGLALLQFRSRVEVDPYGAMENWDPRDANPCNWNGIRCNNGQVILLNLENLSLEGTLASELVQLQQLKALVLRNNKFSGGIPTKITSLAMLEVLDLRNNKLTGEIPAEIRNMQSIELLLLCNNEFHGNKPRIQRAAFIFDLDHPCNSDTEFENFNHETRPTLRTDVSYSDHHRHGENLQGGFKELYLLTKGSAHATRRRLLDNLAALPSSSTNPPGSSPVRLTGSGTFAAFTIPRNLQSPTPAPAPAPLTTVAAPEVGTRKPSSPDVIDPTPAKKKAAFKWIYVVAFPAAALLVTVVACVLLVTRKKTGSPIKPWKSGISGQLQKAFVTGVPKLCRAELVGACEDFSNIVTSFQHFSVYKGTLSDGVEIAVCSTNVTSSKDWSKIAETQFRKKIDSLSRINHKNFVSLLGYLEEEQPFMRMMVLEYAPNGTVYEHLHVEEFEHIDWKVRMRVVMGVAYCLQHMHDLNPPITHPELLSTSIMLSEDYAAKIVDVSVWKSVSSSRPKASFDEGETLLERPSDVDPADNVYSFGMLLLEIISGKLPYSPEEGSLENLALECMNEGRSIGSLLDPTLKTHKDNELQAICEIIPQCIHLNPKKRPKMRDITCTLKETLKISPEAATPRLSPLWWAELEILSCEAS
ncbi:inactive receptor-like serine/threonine-protein kinase At2g40270 [Carex rostrata]